jgi:hypothetical protein
MSDARGLESLLLLLSQAVGVASWTRLPKAIPQRQYLASTLG